MDIINANKDTIDDLFEKFITKYRIFLKRPVIQEKEIIYNGKKYPAKPIKNPMVIDENNVTHIINKKFIRDMKDLSSKIRKFFVKNDNTNLLSSEDFISKKLAEPQYVDIKQFIEETVKEELPLSKKYFNSIYEINIYAFSE